MRADNPIETIAKAVYTAVASDLSDVTYLSQSPSDRREGKPGTEKTRRPYDYDVEVFHFPQTWGSTSLGFGGMGGSAITTAYTTVVRHKLEACVYFAGRFAYKIERVGRPFMDDVRRHDMKACDEISEYMEEGHVPEYGETSDTSANAAP